MESQGLIYKKIPAIMMEIQPIAKGKKNNQQGYNYRGVDDVMNELAPILAKHEVFPVTTVQNFEPMESITSKGGASGYHVSRLYSIKLYASDGSFIEGIVEGEAADYGDKAAGKAHSYAYRDFLLKTFVVPTEGDHDTDATSHDLKRPVKKEEKELPKPLPPISDEMLDRAINKANSGGEGIWEYLISHNTLTKEQITRFETKTKK